MGTAFNLLRRRTTREGTRRGADQARAKKKKKGKRRPRECTGGVGARKNEKGSKKSENRMRARRGGGGVERKRGARKQSALLWRFPTPQKELGSSSLPGPPSPHQRPPPHLPCPSSASATAASPWRATGGTWYPDTKVNGLGKTRSLADDLDAGPGIVRSRAASSCCDLLRFSPALLDLLFTPPLHLSRSSLHSKDRAAASNHMGNEREEERWVLGHPALGGNGQQEEKRGAAVAYGTQSSRVIPHPSTAWACGRLSREFGMGSPACATSMAVCVCGVLVGPYSLAPSRLPPLPP